MCWFFTVCVKKDARTRDCDYYKSIDTIRKLMKYYKKLGLNIPDQLFADYDKPADMRLFREDNDQCLCPVSNDTLGNDKISMGISSGHHFGEFTFKKINNTTIEYQFEDDEKEQITIKELNPKLLFHKLILMYVVEQNKTLLIGSY